MSQATIRTHVVLPQDIVAAVDRLVGRRRRSAFFAEAAAEKLARVRLAEAAAQVAGSLADADIPGWETSEAAAEWVHALRRADDARRSVSQQER
ncbi:MAG TPA: hypothetical protein VFE37_09040 [Chloroflexota bacterium]|nr:hypothetical protein [Chloroflexota bacterium]